jgi:methionine-rich copper-binding protein CopC
MMLHIPIRRVATLLLVAVMTLLLAPGLVLAHAELQTAVPADKSTVTEPVAEVSGIYTEAMTPAGSSLVVKDASSAEVARGTVDPGDDTRMVATPAAPLGSGAYSVESTSVATDGHIEHATWTFTVALAATPAPTPVATAGPSVAPTALPATPLPSVGPTPVPSADGGTTGSGGDVLLPIIVALIILGGGAAYLLSRRNRPPDPL